MIGELFRLVERRRVVLRTLVRVQIRLQAEQVRLFLVFARGVIFANELVVIGGVFEAIVEKVRRRLRHQGVVGQRSGRIAQANVFVDLNAVAARVEPRTRLVEEVGGEHRMLLPLLIPEAADGELSRGHAIEMSRILVLFHQRIEGVARVVVAVGEEVGLPLHVKRVFFEQRIGPAFGGLGEFFAGFLIALGLEELMSFGIELLCDALVGRAAGGRLELFLDVLRRERFLRPLPEARRLFRDGRVRN